MRWGPNANRLTAAFLTGMACALWLFPVIAGPRVQQLRNERDEAADQVKTLQLEVEKLRETSNKRNAPPNIKAITLRLDAPDDRVRLEAQNQLKKELTRQVGRALDEVSPELIHSQLQGRLMRIDGLMYQLDIKFVAVSSELRLYGELVPLKLD